MEKIVIFGNSGSGKSTLAQRLSQEFNLAHLDLDAIAWKQKQPTVRETLAHSIQTIKTFICQHEKWVIEGCYTSLLKTTLQYCDYLIFLNPGIETCVRNCQSRPWEKHKYQTPEEQNQNLSMLIDWIKEYNTRQDEFSLTEHQILFNSFLGQKIELKSNQETLTIKPNNNTKNQIDF